MSLRQPDLFTGTKQPVRTPPPARAYQRPDRAVRRPAAWVSMASWVRTLGRLFAIERASGEHYTRVREHARLLTVERIRACRHDDDLARAEEMIVEANAGWLGGGLSTAFTRAELGERLVEVRNRRTVLALGRDQPKPKGPRLDPTKLPDDALDRLIQRHQDLDVVEQLRAERRRRQEER